MTYIKLSIAALLAISVSIGEAETAEYHAGAKYYASTKNLTGYALKTALHKIIKSHTDQGYWAVWGFIAKHDIDRYYEQDATVLDVYSESPHGVDAHSFTPKSHQCGNYVKEGECYNREHSFPRSWFNSADPMFSDIHQLFPTDGYVNEMRSNFAFGEVGKVQLQSRNGSKLGKSKTQGYRGIVFEPIDEFKGDIARAQLYMAVRYEDQIASWEKNNSRGDVALDGTSDRVYEQWYLDLLLKWHEADPVSQKERDRNDAAYDYQGNRNPFVDNPQWVELIWVTSS